MTALLETPITGRRQSQVLGRFAPWQVGEAVFVEDPFCMFLKVRCRLDSHADVVLSRTNAGETARTWFFVLRNELLPETSFSDCSGLGKIMSRSLGTLKGWAGHSAAATLHLIRLRLLDGARGASVCCSRKERALLSPAWPLACCVTWTGPFPLWALVSLPANVLFGLDATCGPSSPAMLE